MKLDIFPGCAGPAIYVPPKQQGKHGSGTGSESRTWVKSLHYPLLCDPEWPALHSSILPGEGIHQSLWNHCLDQGRVGSQHDLMLEQNEKVRLAGQRG